MRKFNTMLIIALSFVGFSAFAETEANDSKEVATEVSTENDGSETSEVAVEVESPSQE